MKTPTRITGLVAATHTPFHSDGSLRLDVVEKQAEHLLKNEVSTVFIGGSTGECSSLSLDERLQLSQRWFDVARGSKMRVVVHVGSNCIGDAMQLAAQADKLGASAIAALSPSYFKPRSVETLVECAATVAAAAPNTPFYFYDIPVLTNVQLSMPDFLELAAKKIPTLTGLKFTNIDLMSLQVCMRVADRRFDVLCGFDEILLATVALGAKGAVGSTYNLAAPIYNRLLKAFEQGDMEAAREEQYRSVQMIRRLAAAGFIGATKAVMEHLGVPVGPARLPNDNPTPDQAKALRNDLEQMGFFDWIKTN